MKNTDPRIPNGSNVHRTRCWWETSRGSHLRAFPQSTGKSSKRTHLGLHLMLIAHCVGQFSAATGRGAYLNQTTKLPITGSAKPLKSFGHAL